MTKLAWTLGDRYRAARAAGWTSPLRHVVRHGLRAFTERVGPPVGPTRREPLTAIVLNWRRPFNIAPLVRMLLHCAFVDRIVVVNNDPDVRAGDLVHDHSPRLMLRDEGENRGALHRYVVAQELDAPYFFAVDDDLFPTARQVERLFAHLLAAPDVPHGAWGQVRTEKDDPKEAFASGIQRVDREVDILNRLYVFTGEHARRHAELRAWAATVLPPDRLRFCDDVLLSFCGPRRPLVHDLGSLLDCPSSQASATALHRREGFAEDRMKVFRALEARRAEPAADAAAGAAAGAARP